MSFGVISAGGSALPSQSGNSGKFLTTNGSSASWGTAGGGWQSIATGSISSGATALTVENITGYSTIRIDLKNVQFQATSSLSIKFGNTSGGTWKATWNASNELLGKATGYYIAGGSYNDLNNVFRGSQTTDSTYGINVFCGAGFRAYWDSNISILITNFPTANVLKMESMSMGVATSDSAGTNKSYSESNYVGQPSSTQSFDRFSIGAFGNAFEQGSYKVSGIA